MSSPLPPSLTDELRHKIRSEYVQINEELLEQYVRQERARLDLKWCLDQYFGWNHSDLVLGQLVIANVFGSMHMAYVIDIAYMKITITLADQFGTNALVTSADIYSATAVPSYESFVAQHTVFHPQHIRDYVENGHPKRSLHLDQHVQCDLHITQYICETPKFEWSGGISSWHFHDVKPPRKFFERPIIHPAALDTQRPTSTIEVNKIEHSTLAISIFCETRSHTPEATIALPVQVEINRSASIEEFGAVSSHEAISPHIIELKSAESPNLMQSGLNSLELESEIGHRSTQTLENSMPVLSVDHQFCLSQQTHAVVSSWNVSALPKRRYYSNNRSLVSDSLHFRFTFQSSARRHYPLMQSININLVLLWLLLFTILLQKEAVHSPNANHFRDDRVLKVGCVFLFGMMPTMPRTLFLKTLGTYVKTKEILRNLESFLLYGIT